MTINLSSYGSIQSNLFIKIVTPSTTLLFSDLNATVTINGDSYTGVGKLMDVTSSSSELRVTGNDVSISLSGIPNSSIEEINNIKLKGASVDIIRGIFNATTGAFLNITGNPVGRFRGFVDNYTLNEEYDINTRTSSNTLVITCASIVDILSNKIVGRKTNPSSQKRYFPNDLSMDRVPNLESATFNFGTKI